MKSSFPRRSGALKALPLAWPVCLGSALPAGSVFLSGTSDQVNQLTLGLPRNPSHQLTSRSSRRHATPCRQSPRLCAAA